MQNRFNLRSVLPSMGVSDAFNPMAADFTGISGTVRSFNCLILVKYEIHLAGPKISLCFCLFHCQAKVFA